ncbi:MAG TPA: thioesterase family protein [Clostridiaceae bacterium]|nr:thioesterase family protein [Clostridiaceae bacterium]
MEFNIKEGMNSKTETVVTENDTASKYGSGLLDVLSTPHMVALMENTSKNVVEESLPDGFSTVGIEVSIKHLKATPVGMKVRCEAVLEKIDGKKLIFKVDAWDEKGKIGEGTHVRFIVNMEAFMAKLK